MYRIGLGYDIHRLVKNRKLFIGGILIPSDLGLDGHSDADLLIHSICDALLGALAKGDIGEHFSNKNPEYKNKRSSFFLRKILKIMDNEGYNIVNIDSTIICERPILNKYKIQIINSLEKKLRVSKKFISVKATTSEGLGPIGNNCAIACKTVVLINK